jgi:hypothetical protein
LGDHGPANGPRWSGSITASESWVPARARTRLARWCSGPRLSLRRCRTAA